MSAKSRIWFTIGRGVINEVFHPWIDHAAIRDMGLIVTRPDGFFSEERRDCTYDTLTIAQGIPFYHLENESSQGCYHISKEVFADPDRDVLLQKIRFAPRKGALADYRLTVLCSPRLGDQGKDNSGWVGAFHGTKMLFASYKEHALAIASSALWLRLSVGYVGVSDAWQDLKHHGKITWPYDRADHGHIAIAGEVDLESCGGEFVVALGISRSPDAAALSAKLSLNGNFEQQRNVYIDQWRRWQKNVNPLNEGKWSKLVSANAAQRNRPDSSRPRVTDPVVCSVATESADLYRTSTMVLHVHRSKRFTGAGLASLAVPWGNARGEDLGGYHLVWPRDLVEESCGYLAAGITEEPRKVLEYLRVTQKTTGGWAQDMWVDGAPHGQGVQLDEAALPILLVDLARREQAIDDDQLQSYWPMILAAARFIICKGPSTGESRWENSPGLAPYTIATEVAALVVAAKYAERCGRSGLAAYFIETADLWNDLIEAWTYVTDTPLAAKLGIDGYYIRDAPSPGMQTLLERGEHPTLKSSRGLPYAEVVSPDALALVRFGLRAADDPRILNTIKAIDSENRVETPAGPCWRRYTGGYYGEGDAGEPFTGKAKSGHGRAWPLLTGERGHYEIAAGHVGEAEQMLTAMGGLCSQIGLLPEQVWDACDLPEHQLYFGRPAGSAMPLAWTHSEYIRLLRSLHDRQVFDMPLDVSERYVTRNTPTHLALWRFDHQAASFPAGRRLRLELLAPAIVRFSTDEWHTWRELQTRESGIGLHFVDLPSEKMPAGAPLAFTFRWPDAGERWEGKDFSLLAQGGTSDAGRPNSPRASEGAKLRI